MGAQADAACRDSDWATATKTPERCPSAQNYPAEKFNLRKEPRIRTQVYLEESNLRNREKLIERRKPMEEITGCTHTMEYHAATLRSKHRHTQHHRRRDSGTEQQREEGTKGHRV